MKKGGIIRKVLIAIVVLGILGAVFGGGGRSSSSGGSTSGSRAEQAQDSGTADGSTSQEPAEEQPAEEQEPEEEATLPSVADSVSNKRVSDFIRAYNAISEDPFTSVEKISDIAYRSSSHGYVIQMNALGDSRLLVEIQNDDDYAGMRQAFYEVTNALDPSIGDEALDVFDASVVSLDPTGEDVTPQMGSFSLVDFSPQNADEPGHIQVVMDY